MNNRHHWNRVSQLSYSDLSNPVGDPAICSGVQRTNTGRLHYIPQGYEPTYSYPLVVWLFDSTRDEQNFWHWMPIVSDRNYVAMTVRAVESPRRMLNLLHDEIQPVMLSYAIHTDRVFLVGVNDAVVHGQELFDRQRSLFAGYFGVREDAELRTELLSIDRSIMRTIDTAVHPE